MKRIKMLGALAALAIGAGSAGTLAGDVSVGRFYTEIARAKRLVSVDAASAETSLRRAGYDLPALPLERSLTEGDVTGISAAIGVAVTTHRPSQPFSDAQLNTFMAVFGHQLTGFQTNGSSQGGTNQGGNNQGQNNNDQGHPKSPSRP